MNVILRGVVGSTAYGLSTPDSDIDCLGIFQRPTTEVLGYWGKGERKNDTITTVGPDSCFHELSKFVRLAADASPTASELLWLDDYEVITAEGQMLIDHRHAFLSQQIRDRYIGYARGQIGRLLRRGDFGSDLKKRQEKHGRHVARLVIQARTILQTGELSVRLSEQEAEWCFRWGRQAAEDPERFGENVEALIEAVDEIPSDLPPKPDVETIRELLVELRIRDLEGRVQI